MQSLCKNWLLLSKITWGIWTTSDKQWKVQKAEIRWATFVQKIHSSSYLHSCISTYLQIYLTLLSTTCLKFTRFLMSFLKPEITFSRHNSSVFFLAQTLHTFYKSSPLQCKCSDIPLLALKFTKFLMSFFKQNVSFSSKFWSLFSVMRDHSSVLF